MKISVLAPFSDICRREGLSTEAYYKWSKDFLDAGKNGLTLSIRRDSTSDEVRQLRDENDSLKKAVADKLTTYSVEIFTSAFQMLAKVFA